LGPVRDTLTRCITAKTQQEALLETRLRKEKEKPNLEQERALKACYQSQLQSSFNLAHT